MKVPRTAGGAKQGSFGIPAEMRQRIEEGAVAEKLNMSNNKPVEKDSAPVVEKAKPEPVVEARKQGLDPEIQEEMAEHEEKSKKAAEELANPIKRLAKIGIELTEDDVHRYMFKGFLEKTIPLTKGFKRDMTVTLKTLTSEEYLMGDQLLASEIDSGQHMTREGMEQLRSVLMLVFGISQLNEKPLVKKSHNMGLEEIALTCRPVVQALSAGVLNKILKLHIMFSQALQQIVTDGDSPFLEDA